MTENACAMWDLRFNADGIDYNVVINQFKLICKKFVFQLEQGETTGYLHYQCRVSFAKRHYKNQSLFSLFTLIPVPNYMMPTANANFYKGDVFYVMKPETRIDGPWDERVTEKYIPRQYRNKLSQLRPFQKKIFEEAEIFDDRIINLIYCKKGNVGKSTIASVCELFGNGIDLPPVNDAEKLIQSCCDICEAKGLRNPSPIFVDLPRAMNKDRLNGIYTAIEQIKKGKLFDLRYKYKEYWIDSPQIWVFSNIEPELHMLSQDRWKLWVINDNYELENYEGSLDV